VPKLPAVVPKLPPGCGQAARLYIGAGVNQVCGWRLRKFSSCGKNFFTEQKIKIEKFEEENPEKFSVHFQTFFNKLRKNNMQTKPLSMTLIRSDVAEVDSVIQYSNAKNKTAFVQEFVADRYGAASPLVVSMAKIAFREALEMN
jgi:hypothetical protein